MVDLLDVRSGDAELVLAPDFGGGIASLSVDGRPVLRPYDGQSDDPFALACNIMVPFSNRIAGGGFSVAGTRFAVAPNHPVAPFPIHGDGFQRRWSPAQNGTSVTLSLEDGEIGPWRYHATQSFTLLPDGLRHGLEMTNHGDIALPFGGGFHPWFPRSSATRLWFSAATVWMRDDSFLPTEEQELIAVPDWAFDEPRHLPSQLIDNCYGGWGGLATIEQGPDAISCTVTGTDPLTLGHIYSPGPDAGFFCFEPISHVPNAHNRPKMPGLKFLKPGETLTLTMGLGWRA